MTSSGVNNFAMTLGTQSFAIVSLLGTQSCLAWILGPEGRGSYEVCYIFAILLSLTFTCACDIASVYFVSSKRFDISEGVLYALVLGGMGSAIGIAVGLLLMQYPFSFWDKAPTSSLYLALAITPTFLFMLTFTQLLTAINEFKWYMITSCLNKLLLLVLTLIFVWVFPWGINGALFAFILSGLITILFTLVLFYVKFDIRWPGFCKSKLWELTAYGLRYSAGKISNLVNSQIGTIILAFFATKEEIGLYAIAARVTFQAMIIPETLGIVLVPKVASAKGVRQDLVAQCARITTVVCGIMLLALVLFAKPLVLFVFSPAFLPVLLPLRILCIGVFVRCVCKVFVPYLVGTDHPGTVSLATAIGTVVNIVLLWWLLPIMGISGAAVSTSMGYFVGSYFLTAGFIKYGSMKFDEVFKFVHADYLLVKGAFQRTKNA